MTVTAAVRSVELEPVGDEFAVEGRQGVEQAEFVAGAVAAAETGLDLADAGESGDGAGQTGADARVSQVETVSHFAQRLLELGLGQALGFGLPEAGGQCAVDGLFGGEEFGPVRAGERGLGTGEEAGFFGVVRGGGG